MKTNDELFADFIGEKLPKSGSDQQWKFPFCQGYYPSLKTMKFNISWDWLMPIVNKIQEIEAEFTIEFGYGKLNKSGIWDGRCAYFEIKNGKGESIANVGGGSLTLIECVYKGVGEYLQYYNQKTL